MGGVVRLGIVVSPSFSPKVGHGQQTDAFATELRAADLRDDVENFATARRVDFTVKSGEEGDMACFFGFVVGSAVAGFRSLSKYVRTN